jgi:putative chitinase
MILVTPDVIKALMPRAKQADINKYADAILILWTSFEMNTNPYRLAASMAQCGHECGDLSRMEENLNYSAEGLLKIFPAYFSPLLAKEYARKPKAIANRVYANRMGNGPEDSGDGWEHRGKGMIQLTGKNNQTLCAQEGKFDVADILEPYNAVYCAAWFWRKNSLNKFADSGTMADFDKISKAINLGNPYSPKVPFHNDERQKRYVANLKALKNRGYTV